MNKFFILMTVAFFSATSSFAQLADTTASPWTKGGQGGITFSQVGLFNWMGGGQSNMTLIGNVNGFANYKKGTTTWDNSLDLAYGFIKNNFIYQPDMPVAKAEDRIEFTSKFGKKAWNEKFYYAALINFRTQFAAGYASPLDPRDKYVSKFMSPGYVQIPIGLDYKPNDKFSFFLSPLTGKFTFVTDDSLAAAGSFGVNQFDESGKARFGSGKHMRAELGASFRARFKGDIMQNVGLETQLDLFSNYLDRPENIDIRWTTGLVAKVNSFLSVTVSTDLIYDNDIAIGQVDNKGVPVLDAAGVQKKGPKVQFKEIFGLTLSYKFISPKPVK